MNTTIYKTKNGNTSSIKNRVPGGSFTFSPDGVMTGSSFKCGNLTTFNDATYNPNRFGVKMGNKTTYFNPKWKQYK